MSLLNARTDYAVGYGKPPLHTRFRKGKSGNPGGRPRGATSLLRAKALALKEAYRLVTVKEGRKEVALPAIQAILRRQMVLATEGNGPAQRAVIAAVLAIEEEEAQLEAERRAREAELNKPTDLIDAARRVCHLLNIARDEEDFITGRTRSQGDAPAAPAAGGAGVPPATGTGARGADMHSAGPPFAETPPAGASEAAISPASASSAGTCSGTYSASPSSTAAPPTAVPAPGASSSGALPASASSAVAPCAVASPAGAPPPAAPQATAPRTPLGGSPRRAAWRERLSPEAMLWRGEEPPRPRNRFGIGGASGRLFGAR